MKSINLKTIPPTPGVYQFYSHSGELLYIGKAKNLKKRVSSYFRSSKNLAADKKLMVKQIKTIDFIITSSETEALLLEANLIKKHQPPYNIDLKDDKNFLYIKITVQEKFPRVFTVRNIVKDQAKYFGPYASASSVRQTLKLLKRIFPHRSFPKPPTKYQLDYRLKRYRQLMGPDNPLEYRQTINNIIDFLKGNYPKIAKKLEKEMATASAKQLYEKAAWLHSQILALKKIMEKQKIVYQKPVSQDIISLAKKDNQAAINLFSIRQGKLINKENYLMAKTKGKTGSQIIQAFSERFYSQHTSRPKELVVGCRLPDKILLQKTFNFKIIVPKKGIKKQFLSLGKENAEYFLSNRQTTWEKRREKTDKALAEIKQALNLPRLPARIETYDISNIQGSDAVGSMAVFTNGQPDKKMYRKFIIKNIKKANDPAMLAEIIKRRFKRQKIAQTSNWPLPDLIILDGGKGQLNIVIKNCPVPCPIVALAKSQENIYLPEKKNPLQLKRGSEGWYLIQRMRDEAHRFAISFFKKTHTKKQIRSILDQVPGLGPKKKKILLKKFGSVKKISQTPLDKLTKAVGEKTAILIKKLL